MVDNAFQHATGGKRQAEGVGACGDADFLHTHRQLDGLGDALFQVNQRRRLAESEGGAAIGAGHLEWRGHV